MKTFSFIVICLLSFGVTKSQSQTIRTFSLLDLFNMSNIVGASISPDGKHAAVTIERPRNQQMVYSYRGISFRKDIWLLDITSGLMDKILDGAKDTSSYWNPVWSPDSKKLAVLSTRGEDNVRAFTYDLGTNSLTQVHHKGVNLMTKTYQGAAGYNDPYLWLDADHLIVSLLPEGQSYNTFQMDYLPIKTITEEWQNTKYNLENTASILDTDSLHIFPKDQHASLVNYSVEEKTVRTLAMGYFRQVTTSPSGKFLFVVKRNGGRHLGDLDLIKSAWNFNHEAGIIELATGQSDYVALHDLNALATPGNNPHFWTSNSEYVLIKNSKKQYTGYFDITKRRFHPFEQAFSTVKNNDQGLFLKSEKGWFTFNEDNGKPEYRPQLPGRPKEKEIPIRGRELARNDDHRLILSKDRDSTGLHLMMYKNGEWINTYTLNHWLTEIAPVEKELIQFMDAQGKAQNALLLRSNHQNNKGLVVSCYPGTIIRPSSINIDYRLSDNFLNPLMLTSNGYHVLIPTIDTKSTDEFKEYNDFVLPAVEATINQKRLDESKVAIMGLSQGGYLVYAVISQSNRFRSAIALAGYGNPFRAYGNFDMRYRYTSNPFENVGRLRAYESGWGGFGQAPYADPNKYLKNSPILFTKNVETPLLIIQGDKDFISIQEGEAMFTHLYRQGKKARFLRFWGEGHNITAPKNIERMWQEIWAWLALTLN